MSQTTGGGCCVTLPVRRYALGLYSKREGRLTVMPAESGRVLRMEPRVHGLRYGIAGAQAEAEQARLKEHNMRLVEEFGSQVGAPSSSRATTGLLVHSSNKPVQAAVHLRRSSPVDCWACVLEQLGEGSCQAVAACCSRPPSTCSGASVSSRRGRRRGWRLGTCLRGQRCWAWLATRAAGPHRPRQAGQGRQRDVPLGAALHSWHCFCGRSKLAWSKHHASTGEWGAPALSGSCTAA
jgi:hypothetical protein